MDTLSPIARRQFFNAAYPYAPYIVYPKQQAGDRQSWHVRGPGSLESYEFSSEESAIQAALELKDAYQKGDLFEHAGTA